MINIQFPQDPSKLRFHLDKSLASTYLIAKAAKHYGPRNINVAFIDATPFPIKDDERIRSVYSIIDKLGLSSVALMNSIEHVKGKTELEVMHAFMDVIRSLDPTYSDSMSEILDINIASLVLTISIHMGWIDRDFVPTTATDTNVYVSYLNDDDNMTDYYRRTLLAACHPDINSDTVKVWAPLQQYSDQDILESAAEEGLLDITTMARLCEHSRPIHCGMCGGCTNRRMLFISSGVDDNTLYEYK